MARKIRWGILSTGGIAHAFAQALKVSQTGVLTAVASRQEQSAFEFARQYQAPYCYGSYGELLDDPQVDAVYIAPPHPYHAEWAIKTAKAGKAVLCEKPLTMDARETQKVLEAARKCRVFLMEAFMYRCHPQTEKLVQLVRRKAVGEVKLIESVFSFDRPANLKHRLWNPKLGGGGILDLGCYPASMSRLLAGAAAGKPFLNPEVVAGTAKIGKKSRVDELAVASLRFPNGILAQLCCGMSLQRGVGVTVWGTKGKIHAPSPWHPGRWSKGVSTIEIQLYDEKKPKILKLVKPLNLYAMEADEVGRCLLKGLRESPRMSWADSLGNAKTLDQWLRSAHS
jgi:predicted dehydrogenase